MNLRTRQSIVMLIGVNGVGKTTSVGKLAGLLKGTEQEGYYGCRRYIQGCGNRTAYGVVKHELELI